MAYDTHDWCGKTYLGLYDLTGTYYIQKINDQGQKWELPNDEGTHHWRNCESVKPDHPSEINQLRWSNSRLAARRRIRNYLGRPKHDWIC